MQHSYGKRCTTYNLFVISALIPLPCYLTRVVTCFDDRETSTRMLLNKKIVQLFQFLVNWSSVPALRSRGKYQRQYVNLSGIYNAFPAKLNSQILRTKSLGLGCDIFSWRELVPLFVWFSERYLNWRFEIIRKLFEQFRWQGESLLFLWGRLLQWNIF